MKHTHSQDRQHYGLGSPKSGTHVDTTPDEGMTAAMKTMTKTMVMTILTTMR